MCRCISCLARGNKVVLSSSRVSSRRKAIGLPNTPPPLCLPCDFASSLSFLFRVTLYAEFLPMKSRAKCILLIEVGGKTKRREAVGRKGVTLLLRKARPSQDREHPKRRFRCDQEISGSSFLQSLSWGGGRRQLALNPLLLWFMLSAFPQLGLSRCFRF